MKFHRVAFMFALLLPISCGKATVSTASVGETDLRGQESIEVLLFGDAGTGSQDQLDVADVMHQVCIHRGCDFALQLGDNIYENGVTSVDDKKFKTRFEIPYESFGRFDFWTIPGNHDWRGNVQAEVDYSAR